MAYKNFKSGDIFFHLPTMKWLEYCACTGKAGNSIGGVKEQIIFKFDGVATSESGARYNAQVNKVCIDVDKQDAEYFLKLKLAVRFLESSEPLGYYGKVSQL